MKKFILWLLILGLMASAAVIATAAWWGWKRPVPMPTPVVDYLIDTGSTPRQIATAMRDAGIDIQPEAFALLARLSGRDKWLKAGAYEARQGDTPWILLERMANGEMSQTRLTFPEGWTFAQIRALLDANPEVRHDTRGMDTATLMQRLGLEADTPEGLFHPDTYVFAPGSSDLDILRRAAQAGQQTLERAWAAWAARRKMSRSELPGANT